MAVEHQATSLFAGYPVAPGTFDELVDARGDIRPAFQRALSALGATSPEGFARFQSLAERSLLNQGVTFSVYADARGTEKIFPFCLVPRMVSAHDWAHVERGLEQRVRALGLFLDDVYGEGRILEDKPVLRELVLGAKQFLPTLRGVRPAGGVRIHIAGIDLIRDPDGVFRVLEDNLRTPSGVSYVLENRIVTKRVLPQAFEEARVHPVDHYPARLSGVLRAVSPSTTDYTNAVVLTPGPYNSAYFEHSFLARTMGLELVQPADLFVDDDKVFLRTTRGPRRIHVIYRRIDDAFLDPDAFRPDSVLGVRGLVRAYAAGNVALANALGNGVADDKAVYAFVPDMIRFYLSEEPILDQVHTFVCARKDDARYVLEHLDRLVVKSVDEAGGYGMLMGPTASSEEREAFRRRIEAEPRRFIAQERIELSTCPTWDGKTLSLVPRRVDLRPYVLTSPSGPWVLPGGLSRVALVPGSYIVNSSQGGGSKDTWVQKAPADSGRTA
ncbi:circularly permuted type 2 ATP-grasp protein [Polyangium aurulentum]|uniref:circularly permuted type 2 ATP-grasp protein n=1 Tax=Polyangium aurulentum TaxID=2567896 RepID=UPI001F3F1450|nr:circularly permuted type 2 ATP-grasp protein [Polyangium aurulentum]